MSKCPKCKKKIDPDKIEELKGAWEIRTMVQGAISFNCPNCGEKLQTVTKYS